MKSSKLAFLCICVTGFLVGCPASLPVPPEREEKSVSEIGTVRLALGQPIPLTDELKKGLRPEFSITGDKAMDMSLPTSAVMQKYWLDIISASLGIAGPTRVNSIREVVTGTNSSGSTSGTTNNVAADGTATSTASGSTTSSNSSSTQNSATRGQDAGDTSKVNVPTVDGIRAGVTPSKPADLSATALGADPALRLFNAYYLFNAAKALNETVSAVSPPAGWKAYVVPARISLSPKGRQLPYDLRSTLVFSGVKEVAGQIYPDVAAGVGQPSAKVITLGTDSHDLMSISNAQDAARSFGLGTNIFAGITGVKGEIGKTSQTGTNYRGVDLHSLMTAGQIGENMLQVSFGAARTSDVTYEAVERTYLLVAIVIVPSNSTHIIATASNSFVHARTGEEVSENDSSGVAARIEKTLQDFQVNIDGTVCQCDHILSRSEQSKCTGTSDDAKRLRNSAFRRIQQLAQYGRLTALGACVGLPSGGAAPAVPVGARPLAETPGNGLVLVNLAASLARTFDTSRYSKAIATLMDPPQKPPKTVVQPKSQTLLLRDDGKSTTAFVSGGGNLDQAKAIKAFINVDALEIGATEAVVENGGQVIKLSFPSLASFVSPNRRKQFRVSTEIDGSNVMHTAVYHHFVSRSNEASGGKKKKAATGNTDGEAKDGKSGESDASSAASDKEGAAVGATGAGPKKGNGGSGGKKGDASAKAEGTK